MLPAAVIFDVDGTLLDDESAVNAALATFQWLPLAARWKKLVDFHFARYLAGEVSLQDQRRARIREFLDSPITDEQADEIYTVYERSYSSNWTAFPDAAPALIALAHLPLAVLTNGDLAQRTNKLEATGLAKYFQHIFASSELGFAKPHPGAFDAVCRRLNLAPAQCVYVGDSLIADAQGSAAAGLMSFWLDRAASGRTPREGIEVIHSLAELPAHLLR